MARSASLCAFPLQIISSFIRIKPIIAAENGVNPYGVLSQNGTICFFTHKGYDHSVCAVYIFLAKDFFSVPEKPGFAAKNSVNPYGIYIFLAKDLHNSEKSVTFAARNV